LIARWSKKSVSDLETCRGLRAFQPRSPRKFR
jgi:hypothetical protein